MQCLGAGVSHDLSQVLAGGAASWISLPKPKRFEVVRQGRVVLRGFRLVKVPWQRPRSRHARHFDSAKQLGPWHPPVPRPMDPGEPPEDLSPTEVPVGQTWEALSVRWDMRFAVFDIF